MLEGSLKPAAIPRSRSASEDNKGMPRLSQTMKSQTQRHQTRSVIPSFIVRIFPTGHSDPAMLASGLLELRTFVEIVSLCSRALVQKRDYAFATLDLRSDRAIPKVSRRLGFLHSASHSDWLQPST